MRRSEQTEATAPVAVVIPVHRPRLQRLDAFSLARCQKVLAKYPRILVCPHGMDTGAYRELLPGLSQRSFSAEFFRSERGYNRLLRTPTFYDAFAAYQHILIYQADCYVFEDRLSDFVERDYDYVGAPWTHFDWLLERTPLLRFLPRLERWLQPVGNGGLSLRRVAVFRKLARRFERLGMALDVHEDLYFCQLIARLSPELRLASFDEALRFAFELEPARCFELNGRRLPFGCHAFERYDFAFWRSMFDPDELRAAGG
jgi:hypothetical protein